jgi:hypothetical protein
MKILLILCIFSIVPAWALAQETVPPDTLRKKTDSINLAAPTGTIQQSTQAVQSETGNQAAVKQPRTRKDTRPWIKRFDVDINTGFWATPSQATGELMVTVAYKFPKILSIGAGPTYVYSYNRTVSKNLNGYGGKIFARARLLKFIFLWTEYQGLSNQYITDFDPVTTSTAYSDSWFWGAGINFFGVNLSVMYDILHDSKSAYAGATIYRIGYSF